VTSGRAGGKRCGVLRAHLKFRLISPAAKLGGWFPAHQTAAEKPLAALFDMIGVRIRDGAFRNGLLRALRSCDRNQCEANQKERWNSQRKDGPPAGHEEAHPSMGSRRRLSNVKALKTAGNGPLWE
jgi:hypothetical protein